MKYLLTIGHLRMVLQDDRGLAGLLRLLSEARLVSHDRRYEDKGIELTGERCPVQAEALPGFQFVKRAPLDPEVLPPLRALPPAPRRVSWRGRLHDGTRKELPA